MFCADFCFTTLQQCATAMYQVHDTVDAATAVPATPRTAVAVLFFRMVRTGCFVRLRTAVMFRVVDRYLLVHYRDAAAVHAWPVRGIVCQALFPGELRLVMCPVRYI